MGGKSRKTGGISKTLIDKIKNRGALNSTKPAPTPSSKPKTGSLFEE